MEQAEFLLDVLFEQTSDGIYVVDPERRITAWNAASERITGYTREKMVGQFCHSNLLMHCDDSGRQLCLEGCPLASTLLDGLPREGMVYLHHYDGHRVPVMVRVFPIQTDGVITGAVEIYNENINLTHARTRIEELERSSMLDELTGVANRRMGQLRMDLALEEMRRQGVPFGLLMIDIDLFKQVNDRYGHPMGDRVIRMVASSLSSGLRVHDILARWGGEEFLVILPHAERAELTVVAERLRMLVESSMIFPDEQDRDLETAIHVTISLGGVMARPGDDCAVLLSHADRNLYQSKSAGRNRYTI